MIAGKQFACLMKRASALAAACPMAVVPRGTAVPSFPSTMRRRWRLITAGRKPGGRPYSGPPSEEAERPLPPGGWLGSSQTSRRSSSSTVCMAQRECSSSRRPSPLKARSAGLVAARDRPLARRRAYSRPLTKFASAPGMMHGRGFVLAVGVSGGAGDEVIPVQLPSAYGVTRVLDAMLLYFW